MRPFKFGLRKYSKKKVIVLRRGTCQNYGTSLTLA
ncbi:hypothetical protein Goari_014302 [Gossypium aridum]|uniref:Uncharacterized protein n=1 Tax=Gossypium aridum TaxID=34290 RepID=A0A7J8XII2_GOSAI|nr:hypothetical protein [Gossypium aridum]